MKNVVATIVENWGNRKWKTKNFPETTPVD